MSFTIISSLVGASITDISCDSTGENVIVADGTQLHTKTDGIDWTASQTSTTTWQGVHAYSGGFLATTYSPNIIQKQDDIWTNISVPGAAWHHITSDNDGNNIYLTQSGPGPNQSIWGYSDNILGGSNFTTTTSSNLIRSIQYLSQTVRSNNIYFIRVYTTYNQSVAQYGVLTYTVVLGYNTIPYQSSPHTQLFQSIYNIPTSLTATTYDGSYMVSATQGSLTPLAEYNLSFALSSDESIILITESNTRELTPNIYPYSVGNVLLSTNGGGDFATISSPIDYTTSCAMSDDGVRMFVCSTSIDDNPTGFIWYSVDTGVTWVKISDSGGKWTKIVCSGDGTIFWAIDSHSHQVFKGTMPAPTPVLTVTGLVLTNDNLSITYTSEIPPPPIVCSSFTDTTSCIAEDSCGWYNSLMSAGYCYTLQ